MLKRRNTEGVPHPGNKIAIPLPEDEAIRLAMKVKPTEDMPRPGATVKKSVGKKRKRPVAKSRVSSKTSR